MRDETQVGQPNLSRRAFLSAAGSSAAVAAIYATESAMNELAAQLKSVSYP